MIAIIGLGNPGKQYEKTYHNSGFMALDLFAKKHGVEFKKKKFNALYAELFLGSEKVVLLKPQTYMNSSGESVSQLVKKLKLDLKNLLVAYDDVDIKVGEVRLREKGSAGSHNGMKSIIGLLGSENFPRLRIGIGGEYFNLVDYVLSEVRTDAKETFEKSLEQAVHIMDEFIKFKGVVSNIH